MKIDAHNYQAFILDYFEGTLSAQDREELLSFLNAHPEFRREFEEFENISLNDFSDDETFFSEKAKIDLKKNVTLSDEELFNYAEGNFTAEEKAAADKILHNNTELQYELKRWQMTRVSSDVKADKGFKERLKKRRAVVVPLWNTVYFRAAAVITLLLGAAWIYFASNSNDRAEGLAFIPVKNHVQFARIVNADKDIALPAKNDFIAPNTNSAIAIKRPENKSVQNIIPQEKDSVSNGIANQAVPLKKDTVVIAGNPVKTKTDSTHSVVAIKNTVDSLNNGSNGKLVRGIWTPLEPVPAEKKGFKKKLLDAAVTCLRGLHFIGVKKADAVKKVNPDNGSTNYILVLGDKSYSTYR